MLVAISVTATSMDCARVVFADFATISVIWYFARAGRESKSLPVLVDAPGEDRSGISGKMAPVGSEDQGSGEKSFSR